MSTFVLSDQKMSVVLYLLKEKKRQPCFRTSLRPILDYHFFNNDSFLDRTSLFSHMAADHGFNVGLPDNLGEYMYI